MSGRLCAIAAVLVMRPAVAVAAPPPAATTAPATAPAGYERLDISERRITEGPYEASLELRVADERGLQVRVGVALRATRIDVLLRNVKGAYSFRADFDDLRRSTPVQP